MRTRLLVLTAAWPSRGAARVGGFIRSLTSAQRERGFDIRVVAPGARVLGEEATGFPVLVKRLKLGTPGALAKAWYVLSAARTCLRVGRAWGPDAILVHWVVPTGPAALCAARRLGVPLYVWAHGSDLEVYAARSGVLSACARGVLRGAARVFAVSRSLQAKAAALGGTHVTHLAMGVADDFKGPGARAERDGPFTVLFCGDLLPSKGLRELLAARVLLGGKRPVRWICAGEGPLAPMLSRGGFEIRPGLPSYAVAALMDESHVLALPSRSEGTPLVVLEALCRGLPVAATAVGGIPDVVTHGLEGVLLAPPVRGRALAAALVDLYDNAPLREALAAHALARGATVPTATEVAERFRCILAEGGPPSTP